jgi:hypothetical protein
LLQQTAHLPDSPEPNCTKKLEAHQMKVINSVYPNEAQIQEFSEPGPAGPIYMTNLLKFKARADYPDGRDSDLTDEEVYGIYSEGVAELLKEHGGALSFAADVERLMLGEVEDLWDKVAIATYPSRAAGLAGQLNIETAGASGCWLELPG